MMAREIKRLEDQLKRALEGGAWHGPSVLEMGASSRRKRTGPLCPAATEEIWRKATQDLTKLNQELRRALHAFPGARQDKPLVSEVPYTAYTQFIGVTQHSLYHAGQIALLKRALRTA